jgi:alpha-glucosidase
MDLILRAYNDGIAFRYRFPEESPEKRIVIHEATGFRIPEGATAYIQPYDNPSQYTPAYEQYFLNGIPAGTPSPLPSGWAFPALFSLPGQDKWLLITEASLDPGYCGTHLEREAPNGLYLLRFPESGEGNGLGDTYPASQLPWVTPWRVVLVAQGLSGIFSSNIVLHLNPASRIADTSWIKPGRVSWSWWSDPPSPQNPQALRQFVDLAAEMGWEYSLVDANWNKMPEATIPELVKYAAEKGVGMLLWYNSGGPHNVVTEEPRDRLTSRDARRREFQKLRDWGVKGLKVDFFQSDKQEIIQHYFDLLEDAAEYRLLMNFHGCTLPRGWSRTYPHLLTMEAVRGAESYIFDSRFPQSAPWHNVILPFTRNVVGPMDYTPVAFTDNRYPHLTTSGYEIALAIVFESGWLHFADRVSAYRELPQAPKTFLAQVPVAWDESVLVAGHPGQQAAVARRKGDAWYVGVISGIGTETTVNLDFAFLKNGAYRATWIGDGEQKRLLANETSTIRAGESRSYPLKAYGGFVLRLEPGR